MERRIRGSFSSHTHPPNAHALGRAQEITASVQGTVRASSRYRQQQLMRYFWSPARSSKRRHDRESRKCLCGLWYRLAEPWIDNDPSIDFCEQS